MEIRFYHLTKTPLERALPQILEKSLEQGIKSCIYGADEGKFKALSKAIWGYKPMSFITHGLSSDPHPEKQPILLSTDTPNITAKNDAKLLVSISAENLGDPYDFPYERWFHFFDGNDSGETNDARAMWKELMNNEGHELIYYQQSDRGWEKK